MTTDPVREARVEAKPALLELAAYFRRIDDLWEGPDGCGTVGTDLCKKIAAALSLLSGTPMTLGLTTIPPFSHPPAAAEPVAWIDAALALNVGWNAKEPEHLIAERIDLLRRLAVKYLVKTVGVSGAELAPSPQPTQQAAPAVQAEHLLQAAQDFLEAVDKMHDTEKWFHKYRMPYAELNRLRAAITQGQQEPTHG